MVLLSYIGYQDLQARVPANDSLQLLAMTPRIVQLADAQITGFLQVLGVAQAYGEVAVETGLLKGLPAVAEPDPVAAVRLLPGVGGNPESSSGIALRGGRFDQSLILFDDFQLLHMDHFFGLFSSVNHHSVKDVRVQRSGYGARHSGFANGLVQITGREGHRTKPTFGVSTSSCSITRKATFRFQKSVAAHALSLR